MVPLVQIEVQRASLAGANDVDVAYSDADMSKPADILGMAETAAKRFGMIDIVVNNAGIQHVSPVETFPPEKWDLILAINLSSAFHLVRAVLAGMKERGFGRIVNISSAHGLIASPFLAKLPRGARLVNVGRGVQQNLDDLMAALESGQLSGAVLDVFDPEPLAGDHPAWTHPRVLVTPHVASLPTRRDRARYVSRLIAAHERGEDLPNRYDPARAIDA